MPDIYRTGTVTSVLDAARSPDFASKLGEFDSLLAESQTAGRGQFRRHWASPAGNIYAALRLPMRPPFTGTEAAVAFGAWLCLGLRSLGYPCLLKWPNDIVLPDEGQGAAKVCGILLEERGGVLMAGIGVNVAHCPADDELRAGAALRAGSLADWALRHGLCEPDCGSLWKTLVNCLFSSYSEHNALDLWRETAASLLLWRGQPVVLEDDGTAVHGIVCGVGSRGELMLSSREGTRHYLSGSIRRL